MIKMKKFILGMMLTATLGANAATIAVIDSGTDVEHVDFAGKIWINAKEIANNGRDEDGNGYQDDVYGWNFAESNNLVIDRSYLGTFSEDPYKFFELQGKAFMGTITQEEKDWINAKRQDPDFAKEMGKFGNFVHGTHVAGITAEGNDEAKLLSIKLIPTEVKLPGSKITEYMNITGGNRLKALHLALDTLANAQMTMLDEVFYYAGQQKADIANGSFGTGFDQIKMITDVIYRVIFFKKPTAEQSNDTARYMMNKLVELGTKSIKNSPNTLFVFAAGNSGMNNDKFPTSPTNIEADNVISVAATYKYNFLAPFSNYGQNKVDVAAPGMLIHSQIPGNEYLKVSGTSQASPYVARIAAQIKDENKALTPKQIKKILMGTVDKKEFLKAKVRTNGIVNLGRAVNAAKLSLTMGVDAAIQTSNINIADVVVTEEKINFNPELITPIALPSMFK
jgi:cell wall-associated protease